MENNDSDKPRNDPSWFHHHLRFFQAVVFAIGIGVAGNIGFTYKATADTARLEEQVQIQQRQIVELAKDVAVLKVSKVDKSSLSDLPSGICMCVKKSSGRQMSKPCPAQAEICDNESSKICNSLNPGYEC